MPELENNNLISPKYLELRRTGAAFIYIFSLPAAVIICIFSSELAVIYLLVLTASFLTEWFLIAPQYSLRLFLSADKYSVTIRRGILRTEHTVIPCSRILYCITSHTPFELLYGLCTITVVCAGSSRSVCGLTNENADAAVNLISPPAAKTDTGGDNG